MGDRDGFRSLVQHSLARADRATVPRASLAADNELARDLARLTFDPHVHAPSTHDPSDAVVVVDTNCWLDDLDRLRAWAPAHRARLAVPFAVVRELEGLKSMEGRRGFAARSALHFLHEQSSRAPYVPAVAAGREAPSLLLLQAFHEVYHTHRLAGGSVLPPRNADEQILDYALWLQRVCSLHVALLSHDVALCVKASANAVPHGSAGVLAVLDAAAASRRAGVQGGFSSQLASARYGAAGMRGASEPADGRAPSGDAALPRAATAAVPTRPPVSASRMEAVQAPQPRPAQPHALAGASAVAMPEGLSASRAPVAPPALGVPAGSSSSSAEQPSRTEPGGSLPNVGAALPAAPEPVPVAAPQPAQPADDRAAQRSVDELEGVLRLREDALLAKDAQLLQLREQHEALERALAALSISNQLAAARGDALTAAAAPAEAAAAARLEVGAPNASALPSEPSELAVGVSSQPERSPAGESSSAQPHLRPVDLLTASMDELLTLPGIGPALARRICEYREADPFGIRSADDLVRVKGIGQRVVQQIKLHLSQAHDA